MKHFLSTLAAVLLLYFGAAAQAKLSEIESLRTAGYNYRFTDTAKCFLLQKQALQLAKSGNDKESIAISYAVLSLTYKKLLNTPSFQLYADSAWYLAQEVKTPQALGYAYMAKGLFKSYLDENEDAVNDLLISYAYFDKAGGNHQNQVRIAAEVSYLYTNSDLAKEEKYAALAMQNAALTNDPDDVLYARLAYGCYLTAKTRESKAFPADSAINFYKETIRLAEQGADKIIIKSNYANAYLNLAVLYFENPFPGSEPLFLAAQDKALNIAKQYNVRNSYRNSLGLKGEFYSQRGEFALAEKLFLEGIAYQKSLPYKDNNILAAFYSSLKDLAVKQHDNRHYYEYDTAFVKYNSLKFSESALKASQNADARYESSIKETTIESLEKENRLQRNNKWLGYGAAALFALGLLFMFRSYYFKQKYYLQSESVLKEKQKTTELELQVKQQETMEALTQKLSMERRLLQSQMDPHFVFNALGNIQSFILQNETDNAVSYLSKFSKLMRQILIQSKKESITVSEEIDTLKNYIELQKLRLNHSFDYSVAAAPSLDLSTEIPPMLIQPFIENAVEHGLKPLDISTKGKLQIFFEDDKAESCVLCRITDNGIGISQSEKMKQQNEGMHQSMATAITDERMHKLMKENGAAGFSINETRDEDGAVRGTVVEIKIPYANF